MSPYPPRQHATLSRNISMPRQHGYHLGEDDVSTYVSRKGADFMIILVYVDDIILASNSPTMVQQFKVVIEAEFKMSDLGEAYPSLRLQLVRD